MCEKNWICEKIPKYRLSCCCYMSVCVCSMKCSCWSCDPHERSCWSCDLPECSCWSCDVFGAIRSRHPSLSRPGHHWQPSQEGGHGPRRSNQVHQIWGTYRHTQCTFNQIYFTHFNSVFPSISWRRYSTLTIILCREPWTLQTLCLLQWPLNVILGCQVVSCVMYCYYFQFQRNAYYLVPSTDVRLVVI